MRCDRAASSAPLMPASMDPGLRRDDGNAQARAVSRTRSFGVGYFSSIDTRMRSAVRSTPSLLLMIEQVLATVL